MRNIINVFLLACVFPALCFGEIITAEKGIKKVDLAHGSVSMKPGTTLEVKSDTELELRIGEIMVELRRLPKNSIFEIRTPTAVAGVRGTIFYLLANKEVTHIYVDSDDLVNFLHLISQISCGVQQHQAAAAFADGTLEGPVVLSPELQEWWRRGWKKNIREELNGDIQDMMSEIASRQHEALKEEYDSRRINSFTEFIRKPEDPGPQPDAKSECERRKEFGYD